VSLLLNNGADPNIENCKYSDIPSPLQAALQFRNAMIVDMLLEKGASLNPPGEPLLHIACTDFFADLRKTTDTDAETRCVLSD